MIVKMALAKENFIDAKESPTFVGTETFVECLEKIYTFENVDILEFDGNTFQMISSYDPTNSIFIYTNQQGTFLYTITSATPRVHKNNMIWDCNCYKMEDVSTINDIVASGASAEAIIYKNTMRTYLPTFHKDLVRNVNVKDNFKPMETMGFSINGDIFCLKLKFMVNPTTDSSLVSMAVDGSFTFYFPIWLYPKTDNLGHVIPNAISDFTVRLTDGNMNISLFDVISTANLKSIEVLPFVRKRGYLGTIASLTRNSNAVTAVLSGAKMTSCGIFFGDNSSDKFDGLLIQNTSCTHFPKQLFLGGGVRAFLRTPITNIALSCNEALFEDANGGFSRWLDEAFYVVEKDEGWKIDGWLRGEVPPMYINFYTDETGQLAIRNMTSNAQELRAIERANVAKQEEQQQQYVLGQVTNVLQTSANVMGNLASLNFLGAGASVASGAITAGKLALENEFDKAKNEREYQRSLAEYRDSIQTQTLQAQYTGRQLTGNVSLLDFFQSANSNFFKIFIETNFALQMTSNSKLSYITQKDYDYSVTEQNNGFDENQGQVNTGNKILKQSTDTTSAFISKIFGISSPFQDQIGTNYEIVFALQNLFLTGSENSANFKFSKILRFPTRNKTKLLNFS